MRQFCILFVFIQIQGYAGKIMFPFFLCRCATDFNKLLVFIYLEF